MSSPGIDKWIEKAPESWAKLAKNVNKKISFEAFKKKFFEGAENENKAYLKQYLNDSQLRTIYEKGAGGKITPTRTIIAPTKPTTIQVKRYGKEYTRKVAPRWGVQSKFVLFLASKEKPRSEKYN
jgi:hypothetical protein